MAKRRALACLLASSSVDTTTLTLLPAAAGLPATASCAVSLTAAGFPAPLARAFFLACSCHKHDPPSGTLLMLPLIWGYSRTSNTFTENSSANMQFAIKFRSTWQRHIPQH